MWGADHAADLHDLWREGGQLGCKDVGQKAFQQGRVLPAGQVTWVYLPPQHISSPDQHAQLNSCVCCTSSLQTAANWTYQPARWGNFNLHCTDELNVRVDFRLSALEAKSLRDDASCGLKGFRCNRAQQQHAFPQEACCSSQEVYCLCINLKTGLHTCISSSAAAA